MRDEPRTSTVLRSAQKWCDVSRVPGRPQRSGVKMVAVRAGDPEADEGAGLVIIVSGGRGRLFFSAYDEVCACMYLPHGPLKDLTLFECDQAL